MSERKDLIKRYYNGSDDAKYTCIDAYKPVENAEEWELCPNCNLIPKTWVFNNGEDTACGCGKSKYDHFTINAESIMSIVVRSEKGKSCIEYNSKTLKNNWNHWVKTGELLFDKNFKLDGRW